MSEEDPEIARVMKKADDGALNIVGKILERPEVQNAIKYNINKQTLISGAFMSFLIIGLFTLVNVVKQVIGYGWQGDAIMGTIFVLVGGIYMARQMLRKK